MLKRYSSRGPAIIWTCFCCSCATPSPARAQFGGTTVFDPSMYARQLRQLEQETATVTNLAQQLKYMIKNTTGGGAGIWKSNQTLLNNLGGLISEQQGLSYSVRALRSSSSSSIRGTTSPASPVCRVPRPASLPRSIP